MKRPALAAAGVVLAVSALLLAGRLVPPEAEGTTADAAAAAGFQVYHYASEVEGSAFREVFLVHDVSLDFKASTSDLEIRINGAPLGVAWEDPDGLLSLDDRFAFVQEAFDEKQVLTAHYAGRQVMECLFGGGAGISIHPDQWRQMGLPQEVRCLQLTDDQ